MESSFKPSLARHCDACSQYSQIPLVPNQDLACPKCAKEWGHTETIEQLFDKCPVCQTRQFYIQKDFNQALGCAIMAVGIVLVPKTYGLSLPLFALIDWLLHKRVPTIIVCYRCASEFRGIPPPEHLKPFMHHIGMKYDKYRSSL